MQLRRQERQITEKSKIESIIMQCDVCRIAFADNNIPCIVTMNFGYLPEQQCIYFHSAREGRKISLIAKNNYVCFEMDTNHVLTKAEKACNWGMKYSSIVGYGRLNIINDKAEKKNALDAIMSHYAGSGNFTYDEAIFVNTEVLRLNIETITGKRK